MRHYSIHKIGQNRNAPRLWLQGRQPAQAGFQPGFRFKVELPKEDSRETMLVLRLDPEGTYVVSRKVVGEREVPLVDLNSKELLSIFDGYEQVRVVASANAIYILPVATDKRVRERASRLERKLHAGEPLTVGSLSHGGGVLSLALHEGMAEAGVATKLSFANDIRPELLEHAAAVNPAWSPETIAIAAPMQELAMSDTWAMKQLPTVELLEAGIPCEGASLSGRAKNGTDCAEAHADVGHLVISFLAVISQVSPCCIVLENVEPYQNTASMWLIRHSLRDLGYDVHETVLDGAEWNALEHRRRLCMVAVTKGISFSMDDIVKPIKVERTLGEILEPIALDDPMWREMDYLKKKAVRDKAAGKGFALQILTPESKKVGTIGKGYQKNRSTEPKIQHGVNPELLRLLTPVEAARVKDIPEMLIKGLGATIAHEVLGQSILFKPFLAVGKAIAQAFQRWFELRSQLLAA